MTSLDTCGTEDTNLVCDSNRIIPCQIPKDTENDADELNEKEQDDVRLS